MKIFLARYLTAAGDRVGSVVMAADQPAALERLRRRVLKAGAEFALPEHDTEISFRLLVERSRFL
jgi:hypothetical protein